METVILLLVFAVFSAAGTMAALLRAKRAAQIGEIAARAGLKYSDTDPFNCVRVNFHLFAKGDGRGAENVMWREPGDGHVYRVFDFWYYDEHRDQNGGTSKTFYRSSCAMALVGSSWPDITIVHEGMFGKVLTKLAGDDIDFESEEFNRMFAVHCQDRRFASALVDAQMLDFLLATKGELSFELKGRWLLVWTDPVNPKLMPGLLRVAEKFVKHIPPVVWELYPSTFVDSAGNPLPPGDDPVDRMKAELDLAELRHGREHDPFDVLAQSPFEALERDDGVEYDLDGHQLPKVKEDPWGRATSHTRLHDAARHRAGARPRLPARERAHGAGQLSDDPQLARHRVQPEHESLAGAGVRPGLVQRTLDGLKDAGLVRFVHPSHGERTTKFRQVIDERLALLPTEAAVLCALFVRGPQTVAEIRTRTERLHAFDSAEEVEAALQGLADREQPLVRPLDRRWTHSFEQAEAAPASAPAPRSALEDRMAALEAKVEHLYSVLGEEPPPTL